MTLPSELPLISTGWKKRQRESLLQRVAQALTWVWLSFVAPEMVDREMY